MIRVRALAFLAAIAVSTGCGSPVIPLGVSAKSHPIRVAAGTTLVLSGQSNAMYFAPFLAAAYPHEVASVVEPGKPISDWGPDRPGYTALLPLLARPVRAFVFWQGESDRHTATYLGDMQSLAARIRAANANPILLVIEIEVLNLPQNASVRAAQEAFVRSDAHAVLVSSDSGSELGASDHLTSDGYRIVASRVVAAVMDHQGPF
jgi:hypothetical protein